MLLVCAGGGGGCDVVFWGLVGWVDFLALRFVIAGVLLGLWLVVFCDVVSDLLGGSVLWLVQCWFLGLYGWGCLRLA